jgi:transposase InsO family protein
MKASITEEMRYRQRLCEYAIKNGVTKAARRYQTNRQFVYRQLEKYDGDVRSLALVSRRPHSNPDAHTPEELKLIRDMLKRNGRYGLAEVYVRCRSRGYTRSFGSMCRQIRKRGWKEKPQRRISYTRYDRLDGKYPGDKVQVDIKYVPEDCIRFPSYGNKYYQITAIDEYSRKRVLKIVKERSNYETAVFLSELEDKMGFRIKTVQTDNGCEFRNDPERTDKAGLFEKTAKSLGMELRHTRPYSPWQNGKVERSHREDGKILYGREIFISEKQLKEKVETHTKRYNKTAKQVLGFKSPDEIVSEYFRDVC